MSSSVHRSRPLVRRSHAILVTALLAVPSVATAQSSVTADEIAELKARLAQLEAKQAEVDGAVLQAKAIDAAIVDADSKAAFLQADTFTAGWENGFILRSADGAYTLQPTVQLQFRYIGNDLGGDDTIDEDEDTFEAGFEIRRLKIGVEGTAFNERFSYDFRMAFNRDGGQPRPDNAFVAYALTDEWTVRAGQFKLNWTAEESTGSSRQLAVERSLVNELVGGGNTGYVQGVSVIYDPKGASYRGEVTFTDGDATANTNYTDQQGSADNDYQNFGLAVRGEYKVFGKWNDYSDFSARGTKEPLLVVGGGADWAQGGNGDVYRMTLDAQYEHQSGVGLFGSVLHNIETGSADSDIDDSWGLLAQAGYMLPNLKGWEVFGRYGWIKLQEESGGHDVFHEITGGFNKYIVGRNAKFTVDLNYLPNGSFGGASGLGVKNEEESQVIFRAQFQLLL